MMHTDLRGLKAKNRAFVSNQIVIQLFPRDPRSIAFDLAFIRRLP